MYREGECTSKSACKDWLYCERLIGVFVEMYFKGLKLDRCSCEGDLYTKIVLCDGISEIDKYINSHKKSKIKKLDKSLHILGAANMTFFNIANQKTFFVYFFFKCKINFL